MRALVLEGPGLDGLRMVDRADPSPEPGRVTVRLRTAAINHRDLWSCRGRTGSAPSPILGSDGAGVVEAVGPGVAAWRPGDEVIINPSLNWPDATAAPGPDFEVLGIPTDGTFAERVVLPAGNLARKPAHLDWPAAAALPLSALTGYRALFTLGGLEAGETCVIVGIGGGTAVQTLLLAKAAGARVIATSRHADKCRKARALGADLTVDSGGDWAAAVRDFTGGEGVDVVIENIGRPTWAQSLRALARGGRLVVYGSTAGDVVETDLVPLFLGWRSIRGTTMGSAEDFKGMLAMVTSARLTPVVDRVFPFAQAIEAMRYLDRGDQFGKVVLSFA
jgi:zinc-binding alcohol dehydrogenase/oxidoreductase